MMKRYVSMILILSLIMSVFSLSAAAESAEKSVDEKPIVPVAYYEDETWPPAETQPQEEPTCEPTEPVWGTEPAYEEPSCAPLPEPTEPPTEPDPDPTVPPTEPDPNKREGSCGDSAYYSFDLETGALRIYGSGTVTEHNFYSERDGGNYPWKEFYDKIVSLTVEGVSNVPRRAFENCPNLETVVIGDAVKNLGTGEYDEWDWDWSRADYYPPNTFAGCKNLKTVTIGNGITSLNGGEFYDCTNLQTVELPDRLESIGQSSFSGCVKLSEITFPDTLTTIGNRAFSGCTALESIDLPDRLESIGQSSFSGCVKLAEITFPDTLTTIGSGAFSGCSCVKPQSFSHITNIGQYAFSNCTAIEAVEFDTKVEQIGKQAFENCTALRRVVFADGADSLGDWVFNGCTLSEFRFDGELGTATYRSFEGATFDDDTWQDDVLIIGDNLLKANVSISGTCRVRDGVKKIVSFAFADCENLEAVILPDSVDSIGMYAFQKCYSLESLKLGSGLTEVGYAAFENCPVLSEVDISDLDRWLNLSFQYSIHRGGGSGGWTETGYTANPLYYGAKLYINGELIENLVINQRNTISGYLFYGCKSIKSLTVEDVSVINRAAFYGCTGLQEVTLGKNVQTVEGNAFWNCPRLKKITFLNPDCRIANAYETISGSAVIYGYDDSTALMYAGNYNRSFVLLEEQSTICGDADGDGKVTSIDVTIVQRYCADMSTGIDVQTMMNADVDKNGYLEITDVTFLQRYLAFMDIPYMIGEAE